MANVGKNTSPMEPSGSLLDRNLYDGQKREQPFFWPANHNMPSSFKPVKVSLSGVLIPSPPNKILLMEEILHQLRLVL